MDTTELIASFQRDPQAVPVPFPRLETVQQNGSYLTAFLSTRDITIRVLDPTMAPEPKDRTYPLLQLGITSFSGRFHLDWETRMLPEDMECLAALLLQAAARGREARGGRLS